MRGRLLPVQARYGVHVDRGHCSVEIFAILRSYMDKHAQQQSGTRIRGRGLTQNSSTILRRRVLPAYKHKHC